METWGNLLTRTRLFSHMKVHTDVQVWSDIDEEGYLGKYQHPTITLGLTLLWSNSYRSYMTSIGYFVDTWGFLDLSLAHVSHRQ